MARQLMKAMRLCGHDVHVVLELRSFLREPAGDAAEALKLTARAERARIAADWQKNGSPDVWFCYHPYYKARDLLGPKLCRDFSISYVTAEASYSPKRNASGWADIQEGLLSDLRAADINICFTQRDRAGLIKADPDIATAMLPPFIDTAAFAKTVPQPLAHRLVTVAMMRTGDKLESYRALVEALSRLPEDLPWTLDIVGDGPEHDAVRQMFDALDARRLIWHGECDAAAIADILSRASLYVWPGHGEAYGLAYLEAQAAGLPVISEHVAGVPEVVRDGETGILTPPGDVQAYADAILRMLTDTQLRQAMAKNARRFAIEERSLQSAAATLKHILDHLPERTS